MAPITGRHFITSRTSRFFKRKLRFLGVLLQKRPRFSTACLWFGKSLHEYACTFSRTFPHQIVFAGYLVGQYFRMSSRMFVKECFFWDVFGRV